MMDSRETKRRIGALLQSSGRATLREIAVELGAEWLEEKKNALLRQKIARMAKRGLIEKLDYGVYGPGLNRHRRWVDAYDYNENRIVNFLRERGGYAETHEIHDALGHRDLRDGARDPSHRAITKTLNESPRFLQMFGRGVWHLPREECEVLPLTGYWAARWIELDWETGEHGGFDTWGARRDAYFVGVGQACRDARENSGMTLERIAGDPDVREALGYIILACPKVKLACYREMEAEAECELARYGITERFRVDNAARERRGDLPLYILLSFEEGNEELHMAAPVGLYQALARLYGISAVMLTRAKAEEEIIAPIS